MLFEVLLLVCDVSISNQGLSPLFKDDKSNGQLMGVRSLGRFLFRLAPPEMEAIVRQLFFFFYTIFNMFPMRILST